MRAKPSSAACTRATIRRARTRRTRAYLAREMFEPACKDWLIFILSWETLEFRRYGAGLLGPSVTPSLWSLWNRRAQEQMMLPLLLSTASLLLPSGGRTALPSPRCTSAAMQFGGAGKPPPEVMRCLALLKVYGRDASRCDVCAQ